MEPFWMDVIRGLEDELAGHGMTLLVQVVRDLDEEVATHERWLRDDRVAGVVVADITPDDPRLRALRVSGLPAVVMARPEDAPGFATVAADNVATMAEAVDYLAAKGHQVIGRVTGPAQYTHTALRNTAFDDAGARAGIRTLRIESDFTAEGGTAATQELLHAGEAPTAVIYDNDVMALAGMHAISRGGLSVPDDIAVLAWDDSAHCQLFEPPITAFAHDLHAMGTAVADVLLRVLDGEADVSHVLARPRLIERESTRETDAAPVAHGSKPAVARSS